MQHDHEGSTFVRHIPCTTCGSKDNAGLFSDGHTFCFGCGAYEKGEGSSTLTRKAPRMALDLVLDGEAKGLRSRQITDETCRHFGYLTTTVSGKPCQVAPYYDEDGVLVAQKLRFPDKTFQVRGDLKSALPFGAKCWPKTGKMIVVTEGEIDALSMSQVQGNQWPVVSIGCGAGAQIRKYIAERRDYFMGFEKVVLMFDSDEPGREAAGIAAEIIGSRAHIAELPLKDANDMLVKGKTKELIDAMWRAKPYRPDGLVTLDDLKERAQEKPRMGLSWPWPGLTELTYGIQKPYIYAIGAAVGAGKTDVLRQLMTHLVHVHHVPVGGFILEEEPHVTAVGMAGKLAGRNFNTPEGWDEDAFSVAWEQLKAGGKIHLYDNFGINEWDAIRDKIEYLHHAEGVEYFVIDHLTALVATVEDERRELDRIMAEMSGLCTRLNCTIFVVSHLTTPEKGKPHEEGGRVTIRHFTGSRAIARWAFGALGMERDQQHEDETIRHTTTMRALKLRGFGWNVGKCMYLKFNASTGVLEETTAPGAGVALGFKDESGGEQQADF